ncbi:uncharacterized protein LOC132050561 isoform X10 [Lycium ferocissimum]|uniref:uncharacterized protein LOC132050561 isoform X10 n=1 Tax=Lycium ferocissimum TaxID=112874 RepID=UPI002815A672|nr:uncharacterized protein LOC132050561 isoform X10 [Lycium ferocissimum]
MENSPNSDDSKKVQISSDRRTRSQTLAVRKEPKKTLSLFLKKNKVYGKNHVKKSKKRKRLKNSSNLGVVVAKRRKVYDEEKEKSEDLEIGDFYVKPKKRYNPRVGAHTNVDIVNLLNEKLDAKQIQMFRETCFGHFLDLPHVVVQHQLIHHLLLKEVVEEEEDALWISIKDVSLRFGLVEFGLITGLKCTGDADKCYDSDGAGRLVDTYFSDFSELTRVPKQSLIDCFLKKRWKSDEDAVKIAVLYFIHTFLFSTVNRKQISRDEIELVESGAYETYPWGKVVFKATLESMKGKLQGKPSMYRLGGLPLAFQCWFYECCPYVNNKIAFRIDDKVPRILSWKVTKQPSFKELSRGIFNKRRDDQLKLRNISPTEFEKTTLGLPESVEIERVNEVASGDGAEVHISDEDVISALPLASWKLPKTKPDPPLKNVNWRTEFKRLSDGQSELKSEIQMLNKEFASLKDCMTASFANIFKAIESLSKKQGEKTAYEFEQLDEGNDPHDRHGDSDSSEFSASEGQENGKDSMGDKDNNEKANEGAMGDVEKANEGAMGDVDKANEVAMGDVDKANEDKANEVAMGDVDKANEGAMGDVEKANEVAMGDKENNEKANEGAMGDVEEANEGARDDVEKANEVAMGDVEKANEGAMGDVEKANEVAMGDRENNEKANEGAMGDVEDVNEGARDDVEKANDVAMGDVEKANEGAMGDVEKANEGARDDVEKANGVAMGDVEKANEGAMGDQENNEKANEGAMGDVEKANEGAMGDVEKANEGARHDVEKANEGAMGDMSNNEKANEGAMGDVEKANEGATGDVEVGETPGDPVEEVERMDVSKSQILPDTCEVSDHITPEQLTKPSHPEPVPENQGDTGVEDSSKRSSNIVDNVDYSLLTEFDKWVGEGMKKQS